MFNFVALLLCLYGINAQVIVKGKCPDLSVQQHFVLSKFAGLWYEQEKYPVDYEAKGRCVTHEYTTVSDREVKINIEQLDTSTDFKKTIQGSAKLDGRLDEGKFSVNLPVGPDTRDAPYWVLEHGDNYAVLWSCVQVDETTAAESAWILGRERQLDAASLEKAYSVFDRENISKAELEETNKEKCYFS